MSKNETNVKVGDIVNFEVCCPWGMMRGPKEVVGVHGNSVSVSLAGWAGFQVGNDQITEVVAR
jgi:hypothetical protein